MKRFTAILVAALMLITSIGAFAEDMTYSQAPMFDELVESGELPPRRGTSPRKSQDR